MILNRLHDLRLWIVTCEHLSSDAEKMLVSGHIDIIINGEIIIDLIVQKGIFQLQKNNRIELKIIMFHCFLLRIILKE
jgi:hypothetical protein